MAQPGWIKIHRKITDNWLYPSKRVFTPFEAWMDLLISANYDDSKIFEFNRLITIKRGQVLTSELKLSKDWKWGRSAVRSFLRNLSEDGMIETEKTTKFTIVTICNYDSYQDARTTDEQQTNNKQTTAEQQTNISKEELRSIRRKRSKEVVPPELSAVVEYFQSKGYDKDLAQRAYEYYKLNDWKDKDGKPVVNWKSKFLSVWMKEPPKPVRKSIFSPEENTW